MKTFIKAISYYLPEQIVTNEQIVKEFPEWTVEKINNKIGIKERRIAGSNETASDLAINAANKLFANENINKNSIDFLIFCTQTPDYILPTTACIIQEQLGLNTSIGAIDINQGCSGWIYGIAVAKGLILGGLAKNVLLLTAETYSKHIHPKDKGNRTIFGDGAAATLLSTEGIAEIGNFVFGTNGKGAENLIVKTGAARHKDKLNDLVFDDFGNPRSSDTLYMNGSEILNYTLEIMPKLADDTLILNHLSKDEIDLHVYHQPNKYISTLQQKKLHIQPEKYYCHFEYTGNTVSSTIPIALKEALNDGSIKNGDKVLSIAQGLGYSWAGIVLYF
jgi:3-oxoacyl-[acyl-carrier-protein] synthase-3